MREASIWDSGRAKSYRESYNLFSLPLASKLTTECCSMSINKRATAIVLALGWGSFAVLKAVLASGRAVRRRACLRDHADVGSVLHPGTLQYDAAKGTYTVGGSGLNMWSTTDAFHFVWKKVSGDASLAADISFVGNGGNEHRKAVLIVRQSLEADSIYADVALHGSGLIALQYRDEKAVATHEIQLSVAGPERLRIEKRGDFVYLFLGGSGKELQYSGASTRVALQGTYYVGIGVCSHDKDAMEKAVFANVGLTTNLPPAAKTTLYSTLETVTIDSTDRTAVYSAPERFEAPNWTRDGLYLLRDATGRQRTARDGRRRRHRGDRRRRSPGWSRRKRSALCWPAAATPNTSPFPPASCCRIPSASTCTTPPVCRRWPARSGRTWR